MKVLIVDDEHLTREGLLQNIEWKELGIDQVFQADDGVRGLEIVREEHPEIVLSDVRMPRMDGIALGESIQKLYPDTSIIYMSGYSDKEYLKAAIKLKAVRYVEKPIDTAEIYQAVKEAVENVRISMRNQRAVLRQQQENKGWLASAMLYRDSVDSEETEELLRILKLEIDKTTYFYTMMIKSFQYIDEEMERKIKVHIEEFLRIAEKQKRKVLYTFRNGEYVIFHIYGPGEESRRTREYLTDYWRELWQQYGHFFIACGRSVQGIGHVWQSYNDAVVLLQRGFFRQPDTVLEELDHHGDAIVYRDRTEEWKQALQGQDREKCLELADQIYFELQTTQNMLPSQVKDIYYRYLIPVEMAAKKSGTIIESIGRCNTLNELQELLLEWVNLLFENCETAADENPVITQIKEFIRVNCAVETLSVKDISEQVFLTPSYVCTLFKNEMGQTLNQYITEYRMEKAKKMLEDRRYKITDISSAVGYRDGNYFGKAFKKNVGLSPSEYREKMLE